MCKHASPNWWTSGTSADWVPANPPRYEPDYISDSGSRYVLTPEGVYRWSDHWGGVGSCRWLYDGQVGRIIGWGYCPWSGFSQLIGITNRSGYSLQVGETVSILHAPRDRRGREQAVRVIIAVEKITANYVIDAAGRRFGRSTIRSAIAIRGGGVA